MNSIRPVSLALTPTPLIPLHGVSQWLGREIWLKRDDLTGLELSGNKVRKLEYLVADAKARGADTLITCGGEQSNHCRATALAAIRHGLGAILLLRTETPDSPPTATGNILLDKLAGAQIRWISFEQWKDRMKLMGEICNKLETNGHKGYVIGEGGSDAVGSQGYVEAARELSVQLQPHGTADTAIVVPCGSGGTVAGLAAGSVQFLAGMPILAVPVCDSGAYFQKIVDGILGTLSSPEDSQCIQWIEGYVGAGYGKTRPAELASQKRFAELEGIFLDPVYTGKAFHGLVSELKDNPDKIPGRVIFWHTGGIFGLFDGRKEILSPAETTSVR